MNYDKVKFNCLFSADLWEKIEKYTQVHGITKTALVTTAVNEYLFESNNEVKKLQEELKKTNDKLDIIMALLAKSQEKH